jgi:hypothetical protein
LEATGAAIDFEKGSMIIAFGETRSARGTSGLSPLASGRGSHDQLFVATAAELCAPKAQIGIQAMLSGRATKMISRVAICACMFFVGITAIAVASDVQLTADQSIPAAAGRAHIGKEKNGNLKLTVKVHHLAKPGALTPSRQSYVVWTQARGKEPENRGVLKVNDKLEGNFEETVSREDFDVFITAEDNPRAEVPSEPKLLKGTMQP